MTRDDIIRVAKEAGFNQILATNAGADVWIDDGFYVEELKRFAALVAAEKDREILALKEERRKDMAEICSLRESEESLREKNEQFAALVGECAAEQAPDALRMVVADRDALQTENERLRELLVRFSEFTLDVVKLSDKEPEVAAIRAAIDDERKQAALRDETAIWAARHDPRE